MTTEELTAFLTHRLKEPLPGEKAHEPLRSVPKGPPYGTFKEANTFKKGAVLLLLWIERGELYAPLIQRAEDGGIHSRQIALPGGKMEDNESFEQTALRETEEEIGIAPVSVRLLGNLTDVYVRASGYLVRPVVGIVKERPYFHSNPSEVSAVLPVNLSQMFSHYQIHTREIDVGGKYIVWAPCFIIEKETIVWGATAMILNEFFNLMKEGDLPKKV